MDLSKQSKENIAFMITEIMSKLEFVNMSALKPENFNVNNYERLHDLYLLVKKQKQFSISEMEAIASELGSLRK